MIDIKGAFDNLSLDKLLSQMEHMKLPDRIKRWTYHFMTRRTIVMNIDSLRGPKMQRQIGIPQGSPISPLLFLVYSASLYEVVKQEGAGISGFIDDVTIWVKGRPKESSKKLSKILEKCTIWAQSNDTAIDLGDKLGYIHFHPKLTGRMKSESKLKVLGPADVWIEPQDEVKLLGITLDRKLTFRSHVSNVIKKSKKAMEQILRLVGTTEGMTGTAVRTTYVTCVRPVMEYEIEVWGTALNQTNRNELEAIQNKALRAALGSFRSTPIIAIEREAAVLPIEL